MKLKRSLIIFCLAGLFALGAPQAFSAPEAVSFAKSTETSRSLKDESLVSVLMKRSMPYRVLLPSGYESPENKQRKYAVLYLLHGLTGSYKDWSDKTKIAEFKAGSELIIVMPEGANGWYTDSAENPDEQFGSYIINDLIPDVEKKFRVRTDKKGRAIAGLSMGGYGALNFAVRHPDLFVIAGSFSGALRAPELDPAQMTGFPAASSSIKAAFGPMDSEVRRKNDIYRAVKNLDETGVKQLPYFYLDCGTEDFLLANSRDLASLFLEKKVRHEFRQLPGIHDWKFWNTQIEQFLMLSNGFIGEARDGDGKAGVK